MATLQVFDLDYAVRPQHHAGVKGKRLRPIVPIARSANDEYCADEVIELASANDRCWHFSAVPTAPRNVGYQG